MNPNTISNKEDDEEDEVCSCSQNLFLSVCFWLATQRTAGILIARKRHRRETDDAIVGAADTKGIVSGILSIR